MTRRTVDQHIKVIEKIAVDLEGTADSTRLLAGYLLATDPVENVASMLTIVTAMIKKDPDLLLAFVAVSMGINPNTGEPLTK